MNDSNIKYYSVSQYNESIKRFLDEQPGCQDVHLKGEISNFKGATKGHLYFTLKDEESRINAVMFSSSAGHLEFSPKDGDEVLIDGRISVYVATGTYQVYVNRMVLDGNGDLLKKLEELKTKLSKEGLFDKSHKKQIPKYPSRIGIVTAPNKAAIKDILSTIKRRYPLCETILFPALVQGASAAPDIVRAIELANDPKYNLDTLIVGRGGGSIEDLWAFNEEIVARAIYASNVPIISAVGHEIDFTIADFVADLRAPTPTGAAEMAVPNTLDLSNYLKQMEIRLNNNILDELEYLKKNLEHLKSSYALSNPLAPFEIKMQRLDSYVERLNQNINHTLQISSNRLDSIKNNHILINPEELLTKYKNSMELVINKLNLLNPLNVLAKGYSVATSEGHPIKSIKDVHIKDVIDIKVIDGNIKTIVEGVK
ncbi:MAG TPA: exodeoxyribonuclease VII large subunit [Bacilli bacterium]|nr:exodeoxyribonuclease VII large subunit [Bacilli bacterium]HPZ24022.1 exodeoxyribonuclease VII large subunit [Bacilli bacterium]HQC83511.1 exodeoxyribonuclease VII large subunit [Bacilli bacterium]